ncbi:MAG: hypothetical protein VW397_02190 [Candidatus Margulisiibacteriota bacterium]
MKHVRLLPNVKVVCGVMQGAYPGTPQYQTIEQTHSRYKSLLSQLNKAGFSVTVATHNPKLMDYAKENFKQETIAFAMLHPTAFYLHRKKCFPASAYIVSGKADHYIDRRIEEVSNEGNISELQQRLKESNNALHMLVGYLGEFFVLLKNYSPKMAEHLMSSAIQLKLLHFIFKSTFTVSIKNIEQLMAQYQKDNITPWLSLTTLEESQPKTLKELKDALHQEFNEYKVVSQSTKRPFIIGLRTWTIENENVHEAFYDHVQLLMKLPNVDKIIADWEGPENQQLVVSIYKKLSDQFKPRFGITLRALDATDRYLNQTLELAH